MPLEPAISAALALRDSLTAEVARSQAARVVLRSMKPDALFEFATQRDAFNQLSSKLAAALAEAVADVAKRQHQTDISMEQLQSLWPNEAARFSAVLAEIRARSAALKELDELHQQLATRALSFVRAYVTQLSPRPSAYTRRGAQSAQAETSTRSERA